MDAFSYHSEGTRAALAPARSDSTSLVMRRVLGRLFEVGVEPAQAGEFSQRAFLNGKMDLTQAEAVMDLISAQTDLAMRAARTGA